VYVPQGWRLDLVEIADPVEQYEAMTRVAQEAERLGFDSLWLYDHFHTVPRPELATTFECWTITAGLARDTQRIRLGQMATCNGYRPPALLAKMTSTIDVLSHGRLILGLGAGWYEHEYRAYGYGYPDARERLGRLREATEIIHRMWTEEYPEFHGTYYTIDRPINEPRGVQRPHPPLWIAGGGEQVTLKLVARWGDGCNFGAGNPDTLRHKLDVLRRHCDALGRDFAQITCSTNLMIHPVRREATAEQETARAREKLGIDFASYSAGYLVGTSERIAERVQQLIDAGAQYVVFYIPRLAYDLAPLQQVASEVLPRFGFGQAG
jgi:F420-dependent oxidoreductase-like protein